MATKPFTIRTKRENLQKLDQLATATDRSRNYLVNEAIERLLAEETEFIADVQAGLKDALVNRATPHEEVFRAVRSKLEAKLKPNA